MPKPIPMGIGNGLRAARFSGRPTHLYFPFISRVKKNNGKSQVSTTKKQSSITRMIYKKKINSGKTVSSHQNVLVITVSNIFYSSTRMMCSYSTNLYIYDEIPSLISQTFAKANRTVMYRYSRFVI